jgi:Tfp pilus assembly protein PilV
LEENIMKIKQKGGVMVEALVSIALFSVGIVGLLGFLGASTTLSADSRYRTEAITLADELFGEMAASDVRTVSNVFGESSHRFTKWRDARVAGLLPNGNADIEFIPGTRVDSSGTPTGSTFVTLTITWKAPADKDSGSRFVTSTYLY